jgi:hypothetical protein
MIIGAVASTTVARVEAAPPFRTVLDLDAVELKQKAYRGFGLLGRGEICSTYFVDGAFGLQSTVRPPIGYEGYLIVIIVDERGQVVANLEFRSTTCRTLSLPPGSYFLRPLPVTGIFRLEVYDILSD